MIREHTKGHRISDEISEVIGSPHYMQPYYDKALRDQLLGPHSTQLVPVSRFYMNWTADRLITGVVVDFEPAPGGQPFFCDEKRAFFNARRIAYVPIFLKERLTKEQFAQRLKEEKRTASEGRQQAEENKVLSLRGDVEGWLLSPEMQTQITQMTLQRVEARERELGRKLIGVGRRNALAKYQKQVIDELRQKARNGSMGHLGSGEQPPVAAR